MRGKSFVTKEERKIKNSAFLPHTYSVEREPKKIFMKTTKVKESKRAFQLMKWNWFFESRRSILFSGVLKHKSSINVWLTLIAAHTLREAFSVSTNQWKDYPRINKWRFRKIVVADEVVKAFTSRFDFVFVFFEAEEGKRNKKRKKREARGICAIVHAHFFASSGPSH